MVPKFTAVVSTPSLVMAVPFQQRLVGGLPPLEVVDVVGFRGGQVARLVHANIVAATPR